MAEFTWYLNKTGMRGLTGAKGDTGFSPVITVGENTLNNYTLIITNENESFETPNLLGGARQIIDEGGTYIRYNQETGELSAADPDMATSEERGVVRLSTTEDLENPEVEGAIAITPSTLKDGLPILLTSPDNSVSIVQNPDTDKTELTVDTSIIKSDIEGLKEIANILTQNQRQLFADDQTEREVRMAADTQLQGAINAERAERETQDASLQTQLGSKLTVDNIKEGSNITITKDGNNVTISSTGGGVVPENVMTTDTFQIVTNGKVFENGTLRIGNAEDSTTLARFNKDMHWVSEDKTFGFTHAIEFGAPPIGTFYKPYITGSIEEGLETFYSPSLSEHDVDNQTIKVVDGKLHADFSEIGDEVNSLANRVSTAESSIETINGEITDITGDLDGKQAKLNQGANITLTPEEDGTVTISATGGSEVEVDNTTIEINDEGKLQTTVDINALESKVEQLELYKSPNAVINGDLDINNGQVTGFSTTNYLEFPLEFETKGRTWVFNGSFHTGNDVTTQQNFVDSLASVAIAVRSGKVVFALSSNGTTFNLGEVTGVTTIETDTTYYFRLSFDGTQYVLELSTDKIDYTQEGTITSSEPIASTKMTISSTGHPFGDMINLNDWNLTLGGVLVWQGMDSVGISSRLSVDFDNLSDAGNKALNNRIEAATATKQDKLTAVAPVNIEIKTEYNYEHGEGIISTSGYPRTWSTTSIASLTTQYLNGYQYRMATIDTTKPYSFKFRAGINGNKAMYFGFIKSLPTSSGYEVPFNVIRLERNGNATYVKLAKNDDYGWNYNAYFKNHAITDTKRYYDVIFTKTPEGRLILQYHIDGMSTDKFEEVDLTSRVGDYLATFVDGTHDLILYGDGNIQVFPSNTNTFGVATEASNNTYIDVNSLVEDVESKASKSDLDSKQGKLTAIAPINIEEEITNIGGYSGSVSLDTLTMRNFVQELNAASTSANVYFDGINTITGLDYTNFGSIFNSKERDYIDIPVDFSKVQNSVDILCDNQMYYTNAAIGIQDRSKFKPLYLIYKACSPASGGGNVTRLITSEPFQSSINMAFEADPSFNRSQGSTFRTYSINNSIQIDIKSSTLEVLGVRDGYAQVKCINNIHEDLRKCNVIKLFKNQNSDTNTFSISNTRLVIDGVEQPWKITDEPIRSVKSNIGMDTSIADGQWVNNRVTLANQITWNPTETVSYDLSSYLPNDGYNYEVMFYAFGNSGAATSNFIELTFGTDLVPAVGFAKGRTRVNALIDAMGTVTLPVGQGRYIYKETSTSSNANGDYTLWACGYRRIGNNI